MGIISFIQNFSKLYFTACKKLLLRILQLFGKSRYAFVQTFLYSFIRPLWNLLPDVLSNFSIVTTQGHNLVKFRPFIMHDLLFVLADHEPIIKSVFNPRPKQIVVDAGAHIGLYSLNAARLVGPEGIVVAVEPDPRNYSLLKQNIELNKLRNVMAVNVALSNASGHKTFYSCSDPSLSGFQPPSSAKICGLQTIKFVTLSELLNDLHIEKINWLKTDVEGEELRVIQGALPVLIKSDEITILIESDGSDTANYLKSNGFRSVYLGEIYYLASKNGA